LPPISRWRLLLRGSRALGCQPERWGRRRDPGAICHPFLASLHSCIVISLHKKDGWQEKKSFLCVLTPPSFKYVLF
jgi:hypothetical protein